VGKVFKDLATVAFQEATGWYAIDGRCYRCMGEGMDGSTTQLKMNIPRR